MISSFQAQEGRLTSKVKFVWYLIIYCAQVDMCAIVCMSGLNVRTEQLCAYIVHVRVHL